MNRTAAHSHVMIAAVPGVARFVFIVSVCSRLSVGHGFRHHSNIIPGLFQPLANIPSDTGTLTNSPTRYIIQFDLLNTDIVCSPSTRKPTCALFWWSLVATLSRSPSVSKAAGFPTVRSVVGSTPPASPVPA